MNIPTPTGSQAPQDEFSSSTQHGPVEPPFNVLQRKAAQQYIKLVEECEFNPCIDERKLFIACVFENKLGQLNTLPVYNKKHIRGNKANQDMIIVQHPTNRDSEQPLFFFVPQNHSIEEVFNLWLHRLACNGELPESLQKKSDRITNRIHHQNKKAKCEAVIGTKKQEQLGLGNNIKVYQAIASQRQAPVVRPSKMLLLDDEEFDGELDQLFDEIEKVSLMNGKTDDSEEGDENDHTQQ